MPNTAPHKNPRTLSKGCSRPARIRDLEAAVRELVTEYEHWLNALPANLAETELAEQLAEVIEQLTDIADGLDAIEPPRIGRPS